MTINQMTNAIQGRRHYWQIGLKWTAYLYWFALAISSGLLFHRTDAPFDFWSTRSIEPETIREH